jgi:signal transduction histidine kinase
VIAIKVLLIQVLFAALAFGFAAYELAQLNNTIIRQNTTLVGQLLSKHPELEDQLIGYITKEASEEEYATGKHVLHLYGYAEDMPLISQSVLRKFYAGFEFRTALLVLMFALPLLFLLFVEYNKFFGKVREIAAAAERVVEGDFNVVLPEDREGDFSILGHNFNLMANRLKSGMDKLTQDKLFLKNIISDISHQLKTPLSSLVALNELLLKEKSMEPELRNSFLEKSGSQLERMEWLIASLLKLARLEAGAINFRREAIPLINPVDKAVFALKLEAEKKGQAITITGDPAALFNGDEEWTGEALTNIIKNCIEHTGEGGEIKIEIAETPLFSRIIVKDNGEGIDKKDLPQAFERFYKGSNSVKAQSVGIGLALVRLIIEGQGGSVSAASEKGKGTEFTVSFLKGIV